MSRAFTRELEGDQTEAYQPERPQSTHPNCITLEGLACLQEEYRAYLDELQSLQARATSYPRRTASRPWKRRRVT